jgi:hypothetical protein
VNSPGSAFQARLHTANENAFGTIDAGFPFFRVVVVKGQIVFPAFLERCRQLARRAVVAKQDLRECCAARLSGIPRMQNRGDLRAYLLTFGDGFMFFR